MERPLENLTLLCLDGKHQPLPPLQKNQKHVNDLTRAQNSLLMQMRTSHISRNKYLHHIKNSPPPYVPPYCLQTNKMLHHYLFKCHTHEHARIKTTRMLGCNLKSLCHLLNTYKGMRAVLQYVVETEQFKLLFSDVTPTPLS